MKLAMTVRRAAETFQVPKSTLQDHLSGRVASGARSGPPKYLSDYEEEELVNFLVESARIGYARSKKQVLAIVQGVVAKKGLNVVVSIGWWGSFQRRHSDVTIRSAERLSYARAVSSSPEIVDHYYDVLEQTLVDNELQSSPSQVFNMDETGMPLEPDLPLVIAGKGEKHVSCITTGNKAQVTVAAACNAAGYVIPPMVIFDRKTLKPEMTIGEIPGTMYGLSNSGWMDTDLFHLWFTHHFLAHAPPVRPLLLLLDGHSSHYSPETIRRAAEEEVILFCLPPHTTHLTQPLDKGCFGPLKSYWKEECHRYMSNNPGRVITRFTFSQIFSRAWCRGMTMENVMAGFRTTGIFPFNRHALRPHERQSGKFRPASLSEKTGLRFIPLYTPTRRRQLSHLSDRSMHPQSQHSKEQLSLPVLPPQSDSPPPPSHHYRHHYATDDEISASGCHSTGGGEPPLSLHAYHTTEEKFPEPVHSHLTPHSSPCDVSLQYSADSPGRVLQFSDEETARFRTRFEEGYDIKTDGRYNQWLQQHHPEALSRSQEHFLSRQADFASKSSGSLSKTLQDDQVRNEQLGSVTHLQHSTVLSKFLSSQQPVRKPPQLHQKSSTRVLTSKENLLQIAEKEKKKEDDRILKKQKREEREKKRREAEERKEQMKIQREKYKEQKRVELNEKQRRAEERRQELKSGRKSKTAVDHNERATTKCMAGTCTHKKAYKWIECEQCAGWYHCVCAGMPTKAANVHFCCITCQKS